MRFFEAEKDALLVMVVGFDSGGGVFVVGGDACGVGNVVGVVVGVGGCC